MTFEEEFPSLKEWTVLDEILIDVKYGTATIANTKDKIFTQSSVQEHCLDKQRVKEAHKRLAQRLSSNDREGLTDMMIHSMFLEELGI